MKTHIATIEPKIMQATYQTLCGRTVHPEAIERFGGKAADCRRCLDLRIAAAVAATKPQRIPAESGKTPKQKAEYAKRALKAIWDIEPKIDFGIRIELTIIGAFIDEAIASAAAAEDDAAPPTVVEFHGARVAGYTV